MDTFTTELKRQIFEMVAQCLRSDSIGSIDILFESNICSVVECSLDERLVELILILDL